MSPSGNGRARRPASRRALWLALLVAGVALVAVANAHLVFVAIGSQPDCVPHAKSAGEAGMFRAARPAC
ncbi:hypothetical protein [Bosea sp. BIWAKO-01]|uniref:hypothetical protein n=1 Tax=Bosea sp. BIWAKO-01 TaxID=506668 RepID=UPI0008538300|nr:hypothetical protein [Bosea sp. BIWAKO-01]GAU85615.1 hypothetical protein BIWAKO_05563 [Bosea sp. BIWAKO-01]